MDNCGPSDGQWARLLDIIQPDTELRTGQFSKAGGKARVARKWDTVAILLNAMPGASKSGEKWKDAWGNLKTRAKKAYRAKIQYMQGTGGGPPPEVVGLGLNPIYERVLNMVGTVSAVGMPDVVDPLEVQQAEVPLGDIEGAAQPGVIGAVDGIAVPVLPALPAHGDNHGAPELETAAPAVPERSALLAAMVVPQPHAVLAVPQIPGVPVFVPQVLLEEHAVAVQDDAMKEEECGGVGAPLLDFASVKFEYLNFEEDFEKKLENKFDVITIYDTPTPPSKNLQNQTRTPPCGSGFTPVRKRLSYSDRSPQHWSRTIGASSYHPSTSRDGCNSEANNRFSDEVILAVRENSMLLKELLELLKIRRDV